MNEIKEAVQELEDYANHPSLKKELSGKTIALAIKALGGMKLDAEESKELQLYRSAASTYGIDAMTMCKLAKSQIKTAADNIRMTERVQKLAHEIPYGILDHELRAAILTYDGDNSKPYCDLVYAGLKIIQELKKWERENNEWWMCAG